MFEISCLVFVLGLVCPAHSHSTVSLSYNNLAGYLREGAIPNELHRRSVTYV